MSILLAGLAGFWGQLVSPKRPLPAPGCPGCHSVGRVSGVLGNDLANAFPDRAHAVLTDIDGGYLVSVRAPLNRRSGADEVCRQFETGGGRSAAAGINKLPQSELNRFIDAMGAQYG